MQTPFLLAMTCGIIVLIFLLFMFIYWVIMPFVNIKWLQIIYCKIGWHSRGYEDAHKDPNNPNRFLNFARCKWCKYEGQIDSQGNLF